MRELKFRLWNKEDKEWDNPALIEVFNKDGILMTLYGLDNHVIQQWTGLKDKNGIEIYEGDIIEERKRYGKDHWDAGKPFAKEEYINVKPIIWGEYSDGEYCDSIECWMFGEDSLSELLHILKYENKYSEQWIKSYIIIGNIFENPELCKEK